jgi:hypothetical protein
LSSANGFVTVGGISRAFTIRNPNPPIFQSIVGTQNTLVYLNTSTSDIHSPNVEARTSNVASISAYYNQFSYGTTQNSLVYLTTLTSDIQKQNTEPLVSNVSSIYSYVQANSKLTTITTPIPTTTFAYSSGTVLTSGNAAPTATITQNWYI